MNLHVTELGKVVQVSIDFISNHFTCGFISLERSIKEFTTSSLVW